MERGVRGKVCSWKSVFVEKGCSWKGVFVERGVCGKGCSWKGVFVEKSVCGKGCALMGRTKDGSELAKSWQTKIHEHALLRIALLLYIGAVNGSQKQYIATGGKGVFMEKGCSWKEVLVERSVRGQVCSWKGLFVEMVCSWKRVFVEMGVRGNGVRGKV